MMQGIVNICVLANGQSYRVPFMGSRALCCMRKTRHGEVALNMDGPTAQAIIERARKDLIIPSADG